MWLWLNSTKDKTILQGIKTGWHDWNKATNMDFLGTNTGTRRQILEQGDKYWNKATNTGTRRQILGTRQQISRSTNFGCEWLHRYPFSPFSSSIWVHRNEMTIDWILLFLQGIKAGWHDWNKATNTGNKATNTGTRRQILEQGDKYWNKGNKYQNQRISVMNSCRETLRGPTFYLQKWLKIWVGSDLCNVLLRQEFTP